MTNLKMSANGYIGVHAQIDVNESCKRLINILCKSGVKAGVRETKYTWHNIPLQSFLLRYWLSKYDNS